MSDAADALHDLTTAAEAEPSAWFFWSMAGLILVTFVVVCELYRWKP